VVVYLHGSSGLGEVMLAWAPQLAAAGFLTVVGCWGRTPELPDLIACPRGPVPARGGVGVAGLVAAARALPGARADAVGLLGLSAGADEAQLKDVADLYQRYGQPQYKYPVPQELNPGLNGPLADALARKVAPKEALDAAARTWDAVMAQQDFHDDVS
jgi:hypothetical protein